MQNGQEAEQDAVAILTMHGAKGLEYECVFLPDVNEGVTPHNKAILDVDMEEERRMFYVAMTRAKKYLHIYYVKERFHKEADVSRFVQEIWGKEMADGFERERKLNIINRTIMGEDKKRETIDTTQKGAVSMQMGNNYIYGETKLRYRRK